MPSWFLSHSNLSTQHFVTFHLEKRFTLKLFGMLHHSNLVLSNKVRRAVRVGRMTLQYFLHNGKLPGGCPGSALALTIRLFAVSWTGAEILHTAHRDQDLLLQTYIV